MPINEYEQEVRDLLSIAGLPINLQPTHTQIVGCRAMGLSVEKCVLAYVYRVKQYEDTVNKRNP